LFGVFEAVDVIEQEEVWRVRALLHRRREAHQKALWQEVERLFQLIAATVDGTVPQGANWHQMLLEQMIVEIPQVRPAVISDETRAALNEYRGFRHVVRNVYTFKFDPLKVKGLVARAPFGSTRR
jgi:hypothetical protein